LHTLQRDGVRLAYTQAGTGAPPLVFLHGWAGDHTVFTLQFAHFSQTHRTIVVDLRGHGQSDKPEQNYTMAGFAEDIAWLCYHLGVTKPFIVGHSMGGNSALELAARYPDLPGAILLLDTVVFPLPGLKENALLPVEAALCESAYREAIRQAFSGLFLPTDDQACKARLMESAATTPRHVALTAFQNHLINYDASEFAAACQVPVGYIASTNPMADLEQFRSLCPQLVTSQVMQAGHFSLVVNNLLSLAFYRSHGCFLCVSFTREKASIAQEGFSAMSTNIEAMPRFDTSLGKFSQACTLVLVGLAFVLQLPVMVLYTTIILALSVLVPAIGPYRLIYRSILVPLHILHPRIVEDDPRRIVSRRA
jgi:pimeloyl-ACP methyl ester carboxylesterase